MAGWKIHHERVDVFPIEKWGFSSVVLVFRERNLSPMKSDTVSASSSPIIFQGLSAVSFSGGVYLKKPTSLIYIVKVNRVPFIKMNSDFSPT